MLILFERYVCVVLGIASKTKNIDVTKLGYCAWTSMGKLEGTGKSHSRNKICNRILILKKAVHNKHFVGVVYVLVLAFPPAKLCEAGVVQTHIAQC